MAATEPGPAPNEYTLRRLLKTYALVVAGAAIATIVGLIALFGLIYVVFVWVPDRGRRPSRRSSTTSGWLPDGRSRRPSSKTGHLGGCSRFLVRHQCPSVQRYYLVDAEFPDAVSAAHQMVEGAGAVIDWEADPDCGTFSGPRVCFL